jgi:hypothetical protein
MKFKALLLKPVSGFSLGIFRALFGALMVYEVGYFMSVDFVGLGIVGPIGTFEYDFLGWIQPLPEPALRGLLIILLLAAACISLGMFFRPASILFTIGFTYLLFLGKGHYNNHFYLFCIIAFFLSFTHADKNFSFKRLSPESDRTIPLWNLQLFRFALFLTYFYGGLAKLSGDWLSCQQPVRSLIDSGWSGTIWNTEGFIAFITYGGLLFDLAIGFLLLIKKTRLLSMVGVVVFNLTNALFLFNDIGVFPYVMICSTIVFFDPDGDIIERLKKKLVVKKGKQPKPRTEYYPATKSLYLLIAFIGIQLLLPFRSFLLPGDANWTGIGRQFSWRMKVQARQVHEFRFVAVNKETGQQFDLPEDQLLSMINTMQRRYISENPVMAWQFAQYLSQRTLKKELQGYSLHALINVTYNGHDPQYMIDPSVDLITARYDPLGKNDWILPLKSSCK